MKKIFDFREDGVVVWSKELEIGEAQPQPQPQPAFICLKCGMTFGTETAYNSHMDQAHPVIVPSGGTYSQQVAQAEKLDKIVYEGASERGYYYNTNTPQGRTVTIMRGKDTYFIVDPKTVIGTVKRVKIQFTDHKQGDSLSVTVYIIDRSDNLVPVWGNPYGIPLSSNTHGPWMPRLVDGHKDEYRYLIKVTENGKDDVPYNIYWWGY